MNCGQQGAYRQPWQTSRAEFVRMGAGDLRVEQGSLPPEERDAYIQEHMDELRKDFRYL